MRKFNAPLMEIQRLAQEDVFTASNCRVEAEGCPSCYCVAVVCDDYTCSHTCPGCDNDIFD